MSNLKASPNSVTAEMAIAQQLFERSQRVIPGGVNSPVRAFRGVGGTPVFLRRGSGAKVWDVEGKPYIDYVGSWGPLILGHAHPQIIAAIQRGAESGTSFGAPTEAELQMAETLCRLLPSLEQVRLTSSGTEATMSAIRLARGFTARQTIVKFEGCYHGHADALLVKAGSGALTCGQPDSAGVPAAVAADTMVLPYNDIAALERAFKASGDAIAAVIVEPVAGNMNLVLPHAEFLPRLRELCSRHGAVLIFDEVMTGFRVGLGGAQGMFNITPDLTTLGKVIGGGMPVGAFGGRRDIMQRLSPVGPVYQAGTLSGNPIATTAGLATLRLADDAVYDHLTKAGDVIKQATSEALDEAGVPHVVQSAGTMFSVFFTDRPVRDFAGASAQDTGSFAAFFHAMLDAGVYLPPSAYEAWFLSAAHDDRAVQTVLDALPGAARAAAKGAVA